MVEGAAVMGRRKRKRQDERTHEEPESKTLGDAAPEPPEPPPPVQVIQRVVCPYCKTTDVVCHGSRERLRYYTCRRCCDPSQGDMEPTRFKVMIGRPG